MSRAVSPKSLSALIKDKRKALALSQDDLGKKSGIKQNTVSTFELKSDGARIDTLFKLINALDLEIHLIPKGTSIQINDKPSHIQNEW